MAAQRDRPLYALALLQIGVSALALALYGWGRPALLATYADAGIAVPLTVRVTLGGWFLPAAAVIGGATTAYALVSAGQRSRRLRIGALGLGLSSLAFVTAALTALLPLLS